MSVAMTSPAGTEAAGTSTVVTADPVGAARTLSARFDEIDVLRGRPRPADPSDLRQVLDALPITDKAFYIAAGPNIYLEPLRNVLLLAETSGTTGSPPLLTPRARTDLIWNAYNQSLAYRRHVQAGRDRVMLLNPSVMSPFIEGSARALVDLGVGHLRAFPIPKICDWRRMGRLINDYEITAIMTTPTLILKLLFELKREGIAVPSLRTLMLTGEHLSRPLLDGVDGALGLPGASRPLVYGSSEAATLMYGLQNGDYLGYLDDFVFEIRPIEAPWVADMTGRLPDGAAFGRLVVSWLRDGIMPMVRFDSGDLFSCWTDRSTGDTVFRSHGRTGPADLSPAAVEELDRLLFASPALTGGPVAHYDVALSADGATVTLITLDADTEAPAPALAEALSHCLGRSVSLAVNPDGHPFYDFSPPAKTTRIKTQ